jgi:CMP-N-acetylneuraminic acid synthetase
MTVLGLIPARGGSKGIPGKNVRPLCGKPLLQYTAEAALACRRLTHVVLSTDDEEIARVGRACGLDVPFSRPRELAEDATPMLQVVQHALRWFDARGRRFDAVCLLQPTNPLRRAADVDRAIDLFEQSGADAVISMVPVPAEYNPHWVFFQSSDQSVHISTGRRTPIARRQDLPPAFHRDGSVYVTRSRVVLEDDSLYGARTVPFVMQPDDSVNIDEPDDWAKAEARMCHGARS